MQLHLDQYIPSLEEQEKSFYKSSPDEIIPHLYLSNRSFGQPLLDRMKTLTDLDTSGTAILVCGTIFLDTEGTNYLHKFGTSINYKQLILADSLDERISDYFLESFLFIEMALNNHKNVLLFCAAGVSRSPTIVMAYLQKKYQLTYEQAYNHVVYKRPCINPNKNYITQLKAYQSKQYR